MPVFHARFLTLKLLKRDLKMIAVHAERYIMYKNEDSSIGNEDSSLGTDLDPSRTVVEQCRTA